MEEEYTGYDMALAAAGAKIEKYQEFGSYQGDWFALVEFRGSRYWVHGSFGSCSGCDAFQIEFEDVHEHCNLHRYSIKPTNCPDCAITRVAYRERLADFGLTYLTAGEMTQDEAEALARENLEWDSDAQEMLDYLQQNTINQREENRD